MNIKDIAKLANVSVSTVSKVINKKDESISEETRKNVLNIIKEYQYEPYSVIKNSKSARSGLIGMIIPTNADEQVFELVRHIEQEALKNGYSIVLAQFDQMDSSYEKNVNILLSKNVDGILIYNENKKGKSKASNLQNKNTPVVLLNEPNLHQNIISVYCDKTKAGLESTRYLINKGHRNIGCILTDDLPLSDSGIYKGYVQALYDAEISFNASYVIMDSSSNQLADSVKSLINMNVTAFLCQNGKQALVLYGILKAFGLSVPRDISVICAIDSTLFEIIVPRLTGVAHPLREISFAAVACLTNLIENNKNPGKFITELEPVLVERDSVSAPYGKRGQSKKIIVVGSMNMDIIINTEDFPASGKVMASSGIASIPGGKGANQAVGVGKLGGQVYAIGRLGNDSDSKEIYTSLINNYVKADGIIFDTLMPTGKAYINVAQNGNSGIVLYQGANSRLNVDQIDQFEYLFSDAEYCLLSMEISNKTIEYTIKMCNKRNVKIILKPSMIQNLDLKLLKYIDCFVPNESELNQLIAGDETIYSKADYCFRQGVNNVIVTLGAKGCYLKNKDYEMHFPAGNFTPVDTTGAADAFISALAVYLSEGNNIIKSIQFATYAAGISITREGVQPALPDRMAMDIYFDEINRLAK